MEGARTEDRRWSLRLAAVSLLVVAASGAPTAAQEASGRTDTTPDPLAVAASSVATAAARLVPPPTPPPTAPAPPPPPPQPVVDEQAAIPSRVQVPRVAIDAPVIPLGLDASGELEAPADTDQAGWFTEGPEPGERGPAVIAGHLDSLTGPAIFYRVQELVPGDVISVERADSTRVDFVVSRVEQHAKAAFPTAAVYDPTLESELRLITCGGAFNRSTGHYLDNVIVFATRAPGPVPA